MILEELTVNDFGVFKGEQTINLTPPSLQKPIILFGGLNGTGKTTLLDAIQLCLYGKSAHCSNRGDLSYGDFLRKSINHSVSAADGASITLNFKHHSEGKEHSFRIHRSWCFNGKSPNEWVEVWRNGEYEKVLTNIWSEQVEEFIPSRISQLFFFDGEKIETLADPENCKAILSTAVKALLGIDLVDGLITDLNVLEKRQNLSVKSSEEIVAIEALENEVKILEDRQNKFIQKEAELNNQLAMLKKQFSTLNNRFRLEGGELFEQKEALEGEHEKLRNSLDLLEEEIRDFAAGEAPLQLVTDLLKGIEQQDRREEASTRSMAVVETLTGRDRAILKRLKDKGIEEAAHDFIKQLFKEDRQSRLSEVLDEIYLNLTQNGREQLRALNGSLLDQVRKRSANLSSKGKNLSDDLDVIDKKIASIPDEESIATLVKDRNDVKIKVQRAAFEKEQVAEELQRIAVHIETARNRLNSFIEFQVKADFEKEDVKRIVNCSAKARMTLRDFRNRVLDKHVQQIQENILESLGHLYRKKAFITGIQIDPEDLSLKLQKRDGKVITTDRLSAGERQLLSVAILWGLARTSGRPLPAIIDTPLSRLDSVHRSRLVERYFPFASHQVLLLSTDEEINEKYYRKISKFIGHQYRLNFDGKSQSTNIEPGYFWEGAN